MLVFPHFNQAYAVETDGSAMALGAVLTQEHEEQKIDPIRYEPNDDYGGKNYYNCHREALAMVFSFH